MNDKELKEALQEIKKNLRVFDKVLKHDFTKEGKCYVNLRQSTFIRKLLKLFDSLNWQLALNTYKTFDIDNEQKPINTNQCGTPVKIRPCADKYEGKTYFGILLGDMPLNISATIDMSGNMSISRVSYNPAIFIPEVNDIVYGCESWWGEIESEDDLKEVITEDTIDNVWYMKLLRRMSKGDD
jgi:hypothetical protein